MMEKFKRGEKTIDFVKDKSFRELSDIPIEQVKLDIDAIKKRESDWVNLGGTGRQIDFYVRQPKRFFTRSFEILRNILTQGKYRRKIKRSKLTENQKTALRQEFERDILSQFNDSSQKYEYTKRFEEYLKTR